MPLLRMAFVGLWVALPATAQADGSVPADGTGQWKLVSASQRDAYQNIADNRTVTHNLDVRSDDGSISIAFSGRLQNHDIEIAGTSSWNPPPKIARPGQHWTTGRSGAIGRNSRGYELSAVPFISSDHPNATLDETGSTFRFPAGHSLNATLTLRVTGRLHCRFPPMEFGVPYQYEYRFSAGEESALSLELSIADGKTYTQGDDLPIVAQAGKGKAPLAGVTIKLKLVSPSGKEYVQQGQVTDSLGHAEWKSFFTACARTGSWKVVAEVSDGKDKVEVTRTVVLEKIDVTPERVQSNITRICQDWISATSNPGQPNGTESDWEIDLLHWPKGLKVNIMSNWEEYKKRFDPYKCSWQAQLTLRFLNTIRFSVQKERRLLMADVDYGPVSDGTSLVHVAVAVYPHGSTWVSGYVLEPWFNQTKEVWNARIWSMTFLADPDLDWTLRNPWPGEYPTTGSDGGYYPATDVELPRMLKSPDKTRVLTYSPALTLVVDSQGRRVGRLPDGVVVNEIEGAEQSHVNNEDGTYVNFLSVPDGVYEVRIAGTGNGAFHLVTGTDRGVVNYGEQPIQTGEQVILKLVSADLLQPLELPDGTLVAPQPGLLEGVGGPPGPLLRWAAVVVAVIGASCVLLVLGGVAAYRKRACRKTQSP